MKYDCNKTLDYSHEKKRMCGTYHDCSNGCPLSVIYCHGDIMQEHIDIVQKWSDEHPEKTRADAFFEMFPKSCIKSTPRECFYGLIGNLNSCENIDCYDCWKEPYNGEFEKAREEEE